MAAQVPPEYDDSAELVVPGSVRLAESGHPVLRGTKCESCGFTVFPPREFCRSCLSKNVRDIDLAREGILRTYTVARKGQEGFEPPYAFGFVDLPEGVRLYSLLADWENTELSVGQSVELILDQIKRDPETEEPLYGHKFVPIEGGSNE